LTSVNGKTSIQRFFEAENEYFRTDPDQRDLGSLLALLDPDIVVEVPGSLPHGGLWRGHHGFEALFAAVAAHWNEFRVVHDEAMIHLLADNRVMCEAMVRGIRRATGEAVDTPIVSFVTFSDLGISHLVHYYKDTGALVSADNRSQNGSLERRLLRLEDEDSIRKTVTRYALALDAADWDALVGCFTEQARFDFSSSSSWPPRTMSAATWVREFAAANLSGFTARQHLSLNHEIRIEGDQAFCSSYEFAQHFLAGVEDPFNVEHGRYEHTLVRSGQEWLISSLTLKVWWTEGNTDLFGMAAGRLPRR